MSLPWAFCQIVFRVRDTNPLEQLFDVKALNDPNRLPLGWSLRDIDEIGDGWSAAIFLVEVLPTSQDGQHVAAILNGIGARPEDYV